MIMVVPVALVMPTSFMFIPPSTAVFPAPYSCFMELVSPVIRLSAVVTVLFNRAVQLVVCVNQPPLAIVLCVNPWRSRQEHARNHRCCAGELDQACFPSTLNHGQLPPQITLEAGLPWRHTGFLVWAWFYVNCIKPRVRWKVLVGEFKLNRCAQFNRPVKTGLHPCDISQAPRE